LHQQQHHQHNVNNQLIMLII
ncbi:unnamed protein product, partial [Rotaria sp. Silwood1]